MKNSIAICLFNLLILLTVYGCTKSSEARIEGIPSHDGLTKVEETDTIVFYEHYRKGVYPVCGVVYSKKSGDVSISCDY